MKAFAVVGAAYGDEGKGLMTDYLASTLEGNNAVVRFNGTAQAGHTVQLPDGTRHVFSHFGSGTFCGLPTILSEHFAVHPILFKKEHNELIQKGYKPTVYLNPKSLIVTPYDIIGNRVSENHRGANRHGSVGVGFGAAIERNEEISFTAEDLHTSTPAELIDKITTIKDWWKNNILFGDNEQDQELLHIFNTKGLFAAFLIDCAYLVAETKYMYDLNSYDNLIFEGAQGLMLDQSYGDFPHVTRSNTGVQNIKEILETVDNVEELQVYYISRSYTTRHGAGPLLGEEPFPEHIVDETNKPNEFQGTLRYAPLQLDQVFKLSNSDFRTLQGVPYEATQHIVFTCLDQLVGQDCKVRMGNQIMNMPAQLLQDMLYGCANYVSFGPTRNDVVKVG